LAYYNKAIAFDPQFAEPYFMTGDIYRSQADWRGRSRPQERKELVQKALEKYAQALALNPLNSEVILRQARAYEMIDDYDQALKSYDRALEVDPGNGFVFASLGRFYRHIGEDKKALDAFRRAGEVNWSNDLMPYINLQDLQNSH
jgi:superkiller protein 3